MDAVNTGQNPPLPVSAFNFRDFGGHATHDGRRIRRGALYRSGAMTGLTPDDLVLMRDLGIDTVFDLRRTEEAAAQPTPWQTFAANYWSRDHDVFSGVLGAVLRDTENSAEPLRAAMIDLYRRLPSDHAPAYREILHRLADGVSPVLINCSAGKDRTGVAVALVLTVAGALKSAIIEDYLATNAADFSVLYVGRDDGPARMYRQTPHLLHPLLTADLDYLEAAYAVFDAEYGGIEGYARDALDVDAGMQERIRQILLED